MEVYWQRIRRLREERGLTNDKLYLATGGEISTATLISIQNDPASVEGRRWRYPSPETLEIVAKALGVEPTEFPEYVLAKARDRLDDRVVGLDVAMTNLQATP